VTDAALADVRVFAPVGSLDDVREALRARFDEMEVARTVIDDAAGLQEGYAAKLLAGLKRFGDISLFPMIQTAGLRLALIEDPDAASRLQALPKRVQHAVRCRPVGKALMKAARPAVLRELGAKGGRAAMAKLSPEQRREFARQAARARWGKRAAP
jgi:hypothetical protein